MTTPAEIETAERLLRQVNDCHEPYAPSVLPVARVLVVYREELLAQIAEALAPTTMEAPFGATDPEILECARELVARLRTGEARRC